MSETARLHSSNESSLRSPASPGPLRDWLAAMRATAPEAKTEERVSPVANAVEQVEDRVLAWAPQPTAPTTADQDDEVAEIVAENMMLKAKLRLEAERRDELQILLAQEIRDMRAHINEEIANLEDLRAERDLWKARCEALMQPLFTGASR